MNEKCPLADHNKCIYCDSFRSCYADEIINFKATTSSPPKNTYALKIKYAGGRESVYPSMSLFFAADLADTLLKSSDPEILEINITKEGTKYEPHPNDQCRPEPEIDSMDT